MSFSLPAQSQSDSYDDAMILCDEIEELASEMPERGEEFASSVLEKSGSIRESIEERGSATEKQIAALENMKAGLERWMR